MSINLSQLNLSKSGLQKFLESYQYIISILATIVFFSEVAEYLLDAKISPINALTWIAIFTLAALPFAKKIATMPRMMVIGMIVYLAVSILSLMTVSADEISVQEVRTRILSVYFVCLMYVIYNQKSLKHIKYTIVGIVIVSVFNNFIELANPQFFSEINVGRPAGFYINPNRTATAMMLGMLLTVYEIKKPLRLPYVLFVGMGILPTFTRSAIIGWIIAVILLTANRVLSDKRRTVILPLLTLITFLIIANPLQTLTNYFSGRNDNSYWNVLDRLEQFQNPTLSDDSAQDRGAVAKEAWRMFGEHPFWGNGLGSTVKWTIAPFSTHNMYLYYMADHGIVGLIFLPGAIFAVVYGNKGEKKVILTCYAVFMIVWGIFSHNVLETRYILATFALLTAMRSTQPNYFSYPPRPQDFQLALPPARAQLILPPARQQRALPPANYQKTFPPTHD
jgi:hypothetical protein